MDSKARRHFWSVMYAKTKCSTSEFRQNSTMLPMYNLTTIGPTLNQSNETTADEEGPPELYLLIIEITCLCTISIVGTIANLMICTASIRRKRKTSEYFVLNLAITDLMICSIGIPLDIYEQMHAGAWQYGAVLCKLIYPSQTLFLLVSIMTLTAMSLERYRAIVTPMKQKLRKSVILGTIGLVWIIGCTVVLPYSMMLNYTGTFCDEQWPGANDANYYTLALFVIDYCIPLTIIVYCYSRAGLELHRKFKQLNMAPGFTRRRNMSKNHELALKKRLQRNKKVAKVFSFAVLMFVVCVLPGDCYWMWKSFGDGSTFQHERLFETLVKVLVYSNSAINPFIFGAFQGACSRRKQMVLRFSTVSEKVENDGRQMMTRITTTRKSSDMVSEKNV